MNARLEYYRQLQQISDMVQSYEGPTGDNTVTRMLLEEEKLSRKVAVAKSKRAYLDLLRKEASKPEEQRICVICQDKIEIGTLTVCGHQYCKDCMGHWWRGEFCSSVHLQPWESCF